MVSSLRPDVRTTVVVPYCPSWYLLFQISGSFFTLTTVAARPYLGMKFGPRRLSSIGTSVSQSTLGP